MFGYIRPWKAELKVKEFSRYQAVYCGLCKTISRDYGQVPRLATSYDVTFLALLLLSLEGESHGFTMEGCILHPGQKRPTAKASSPLDFAAAAAILLSWHKFQDNVEDREKVLSSQSLKLSFARARKKAKQAWPDLDLVIAEGMVAQREMERTSKMGLRLEDAAGPFGRLLGEVMRLAPINPEPSAEVREGLAYLGTKLGAWIYLIDAQEDVAADLAEKRYNPLQYRDPERGKEEMKESLIRLEEEIDLTCDLLPYYRDAAIISNVIQLGLPQVREQIFAGEKLVRL